MPTFLGLGVLRSGTSLVHTWLSDHPQVCTAIGVKEVNFFDRYYDRGWEWYGQLFRPATGERAVGEFSVSYIFRAAAVERIATDLPHVRAIVCLRDPVARIVSQYRQWVMVDGYRGALSDFIRDHPNAVERSYYAPQLRRLYEHFPRERVKVLVYERFTADVGAAASDLYAYIGVDTEHTPGSLTGRPSASVAPRHPLLWRAAKRLARRVDDADKAWLRRIAGRLPVRSVLVGAAGDAVPSGSRIEPGSLGALQEQYAEDVVETGRLLGQDLGDVWGRANGSDDGQP